MNKTNVDGLPPLKVHPLTLRGNGYTFYGGGGGGGGGGRGGEGQPCEHCFCLLLKKGPV